MRYVFSRDLYDPDYDCDDAARDEDEPEGDEYAIEASIESRQEARKYPGDTNPYYEREDGPK